MLLERYISSGKNFKFRDYYVKSGNEGLLRTMRFLSELPQVLDGVQKVLQEKASIAHHRSLVSALADFEPPDDTTRCYLSAPPPYSILYKTDAGGPEGTKKVELCFVHSMASVQIVDTAAPQRACRWTTDINGDVRTWPRGNLIPLDARDIGVPQEEFQAVSKELEERSLAVLKKLGTVWERFPGLYGLSLKSTELVRITESAHTLSFQVASDDANELLAIVTQDEGKKYNVDKLEDTEKQSVIVTLTRLPEPEERVVPEADEVQATNTELPLITRQFVKEYCPDYYELLRQLKKFGVTVEHGKGSHDCLCLAGYKITMSQNQRDGTLLMNRHVIRQVLGCLRIPEGDFVHRVSTKSF